MLKTQKKIIYSPRDFELETTLIKTAIINNRNFNKKYCREKINKDPLVNKIQELGPAESMCG